MVGSSALFARPEQDPSGNNWSSDSEIEDHCFFNLNTKGTQRTMKTPKANLSSTPLSFHLFQMDMMEHLKGGTLIVGDVVEAFHPTTCKKEALLVVFAPDKGMHRHGGSGMWIRNADPLSDNWSLAASKKLGKKLGDVLKTVHRYHDAFPTHEEDTVPPMDMESENPNARAWWMHFAYPETTSSGSVKVPNAVKKEQEALNQEGKADKKRAEISPEIAEAVAEARKAAQSKAKAKGKKATKGKAKAKTTSKAKATKTVAKAEKAAPKAKAEKGGKATKKKATKAKAKGAKKAS